MVPIRIHLLRSAEYEQAKFDDVLHLLQSFPGCMSFLAGAEPIEFSGGLPSKGDPYQKKMPPVPVPAFSGGHVSYSLKKSYREKKTITWKKIFESLTSYRIRHDIGNQEFLVLLTEHNNDYNWFSAGNPSTQRDFFVQTEHWEYFSGSDQRYPVAYQTVSGVLKQLVFTSFSDLMAHWHNEPRGCMLDFCAEKVQISLKLRTGDICPDCLNLFAERKVDHAVMDQVFRVIDGIRKQMVFKNRFVINRKAPTMQISRHSGKLKFPDLGSLEIRLTPLEHTVYLFFLNHPEGMEISHIAGYREELTRFYLPLSHSENADQVRSRIEDLSNPLENSISEKISRIKRKFTDALGSEMAQDFIIAGENAGPKKILLDRTVLQFL
jgi:hypothetical protein